MPKVIFTTAYSQYAVEAFKVQALNYVLKPLDDDKIRDSLIRAKEALGRSEFESKSKMLSAIHDISGSQSVITQKSNSSLIVKDTDKVSFLDKAHLKWVEADGDYVCIHMKDKTHLIRATLKSIEDQLSDVNFQRIHRSTIVNLDYEYGAATEGESKLRRSFTDKNNLNLFGFPIHRRISPTHRICLALNEFFWVTKK